ncbi:MAG: hypothetical protein A2249_03845 [Candidatus Jacksonbacteria bacterium RIFOXYA2_FULL_44_7]|uniref:Type II secretion system protein GspG C-terminal domain-containing protein n=1 Tax=Candidatus Jacksonbacteria bacterium RIFCSPLOWO2_02_FULL_44_20 TaxID=1798460 RepID=A0A1G2A7D7_9BACT|nr:MAG: hypothetical protein UW39_C0006G0021 [Parcubacteria group bacterium GW2011_GWC2_44_17]KKT50556.1 MAG: hypothetical protein UW40_C0002G0016 [Parcubacteria group bacterium GW2011_GWF2_44_17]OGY70976.1 MAG: hypothetical protein A3C00_02455 [Candidatus Jacksonbacteria bacterium RIFCSPHIGHO2_02_FULL_44_25]OGY71366.1 MAG: hypothetical protein A3E05_02775 [Candidatus Jacksonbacteria bacterium RIFCSPHIGHO2_12_FULL_44_12]OGY72681.1 MAG: hypothetical protein A3H61_01665 [Candidatus Jacksonbacteri
MNFISIKTGIFFVIILALLLGIILREGAMRKKEDAAVALVEISAIRAGLSAYFAERGGYPKIEKVLIGGSDARSLCLSRNAGEQEGFLGEGITCSGSVVYNGVLALESSQFFYSSSGAEYGVQFSIPSAFGAFTSSGVYCATEKGIFVGECE